MSAVLYLLPDDGWSTYHAALSIQCWLITQLLVRLSFCVGNSACKYTTVLLTRFSIINNNAQFNVACLLFLSFHRLLVGGAWCFTFISMNTFRMFAVYMWPMRYNLLSICLESFVGIFSHILTICCHVNILILQCGILSRRMKQVSLSINGLILVASCALSKMKRTVIICMHFTLYNINVLDKICVPCSRHIKNVWAFKKHKNRLKLSWLFIAINSINLKLLQCSLWENRLFLAVNRLEFNY